MTTENKTLEPEFSRLTIKHENKNTLHIDTLLKFVDSYDGNRDDLSSWLTNCDRAFALAKEDQKLILFSFVQNRLKDRAQSTCSNTIFEDWEDLKDFLKSRFGNRKHHSHLLTELQTCKQIYTETVAQYINRIETCLKRLLSSVKQANIDPNLLPGEVAYINKLALHAFLIGISNNISQVLRSREPQSLNDAFNMALEEEKFHITQNKTKHCNKCNRDGHTTFNCRRNFSNNNNYKPPFNNNNNNNYKSYDKNKHVLVLTKQKLFCKYCKKQGHLMEKCFKKQRIDQIKQNENVVSTTYDQAENSITESYDQTEYCNYCKEKGHIADECLAYSSLRREINARNLRDIRRVNNEPYNKDLNENQLTASAGPSSSNHFIQAQSI